MMETRTTIAMNFNRYVLITILLLYSTTAQGQSKGKLIVFVGEKIKVSQIADRDIQSWDVSGLYTYKILKKIYGDFKGDTIQFEAYDHYGTPPFSSYEHVLLFVTEYDGKFFHEKYQYFEVYKTKNGRWASPGDPYRFENTILGRKVEFKQKAFLHPVIFEVVNGRLKKPVNITQLELIFREPYFHVKASKAIAFKGTAVEDLFTLKKEGALKARGLF